MPNRDAFADAKECDDLAAVIVERLCLDRRDVRIDVWRNL